MCKWGFIVHCKIVCEVHVDQFISGVFKHFMLRVREMTMYGLEYAKFYIAVYGRTNTYTQHGLFKCT